MNTTDLRSVHAVGGGRLGLAASFAALGLFPALSGSTTSDEATFGDPVDRRSTRGSAVRLAASDRRRRSTIDGSIVRRSMAR